jgi:hypothetical protein
MNPNRLFWAKGLAERNWAGFAHWRNDLGKGCRSLRAVDPANVVK